MQRNNAKSKSKTMQRKIRRGGNETFKVSKKFLALLLVKHFKIQKRRHFKIL
jgi:hypothetical protein